MAKPRTTKQKAALRKAQLASARKRKRKATVRNVGRGLVGSKKGSNKRKYRLIRAGAAVAATAAVAYGVHRLNGRKSKMKAPKTDYAHRGGSGKSTTKPRPASIGKSSHNAGKLKYRHETRLRQHRKAGERGMYNAGLGSHGTKTHVMGARKSLLPKTNWDSIHPNVRRRILRNNSRR